MNVQGVIFSGLDHYAVEHLPDGACRVSVWIDDDDDYEERFHYARVWTFRRLEPDAKFGGAYNTRQTHTIYCNDGLTERLDSRRPSSGFDFDERPLSEFVKPSDSAIRHGVWMPDEAYDLAEQGRAVRGWREWTDGLPAKEIVGGKLRGQRQVGRWNKAKGTRTYILHNSALTTGSHVATNELRMQHLITQAASTLDSGSIGGNDNAEAYMFTTEAGEPNDASWPTGNYRCQLDCTTAGPDVTYGVLDQGASNGHFARVDSGATADSESKQQTQGAQSGTGAKLLTTGSVSWSAGNASDRFEVLVSIARPVNHGNQSIVLELYEDDDFADGPWPSDFEDTIAVTDSVAAQIIAAAIERTVTDTPSVTDAVAVELEYERALADVAEVVTDQVATELEFERTLTDTPSVTDEVNCSKAYALAVTDTPSVTDAVTVELEYERVAADVGVVATDAAATALEYERVVTDTPSVTDAVAAEKLGGQVFERTVGDTPSVTDAVAVVMDYAVVVTDTPSTSDQAATALDYAVVVSDASSVADAAAPALEYERTPATDAIVVVDALSPEVVVSPQDTAVVADSVTIALEYGRTVGDTPSVTDQVVAEILGVVAVLVGDTVVVADVAATALDYQRNPIDTLSVTDVAAAGLVLEVVITDTPSVSDQVSPTFEPDTLQDVAAVTDAVAVVHDAHRLPADAVTVADSSSIAADYARTPADSVSTTDGVTAELMLGDIEVAVSDAVSVADSTAAEAVYERAPADAVVVSDSAALAMVFEIVISDSLAVTEALVAIFANDLQVAGALKLQSVVQGSIDQSNLARGALKA